MDSIQSLLSKRQDLTLSDPSFTPPPTLHIHQNTPREQNLERTLQNETPPLNSKPQTPPETHNHIDPAKITQILLNLRAQIDAALLLVSNQSPAPTQFKTTPPPTTINNATNPNQKNSAIVNGNIDNRNQLQIIEGVFNGEKMVGPDGHEYSIPTNYASKSKLVEGDMMKLTISPTGAFIYKQIGPIERRRLIGEALLDDKTGQWSVTTNKKTYKILTASTTFFHAKPGMQAVILVPKDGESRWAAVENIFSPNQYQ